MTNFFAQGIGFLAVLAFVISYQIKSNRALYLCQLTGCALFSLQFFLLGAASGSVSLLLNMLRYGLLLKYRDWAWVRNRVLPLLFCGLYGLVTALTWNGWVSLLTLAASLSSTVCYWTNNARTIRMGNLLCASPCWLVYDICVGSWGGVVSESITLGSIVVSIYRFGWNALGQSESQAQN